MKKLLLLTAVIFSISTTFAQRKPNDKYYTVRFKEKRYPLKPLPKEFKTYSSKITGETRLDKFSLRGEYLKIKGLQKNNQSPNLLVLVKLPMEGFGYSKDLKKKEYKRDDGTKYYRYYYRISYEYGIKYRLINTKNDNVIDEKYFDMGDTKDMPESSSYSAAYEYWKNNRTKKVREIERSIVRGALRQIKERIESNHCLVDVTRATDLGTVKGKGTRLPDVKETYEIAKKAVEAYKKGGKDAAKPQLEDALKRWTKILEEVDLKSKKSRVNYRMARMLYYNCAFFYYLLDDFDNSHKYADECVKIKGVRYKANRIKSWADDKKARHQANGL